MNPYEQEIYTSIENKIRHLSLGDYLRNIDVLEMLWKGRMMRLRQASSYTKLIGSALDRYDENLIDVTSDIYRTVSNYDELESPAKLTTLSSMVDEFIKSNRKIVIWGHFIDCLDMIEQKFLSQNIYCKVIYGKTPTEQSLEKEEETREMIRKEFVDKTSGLDVLIANPAACSESISLHKTCFTAIYYDLSFNCAQFMQSQDRIHRVGGSEKQEAHYYFLMYENTIEQRIANNLTTKANKMNHLLDQDYERVSLDMFDSTDDVEIYQGFFETNND